MGENETFLTAVTILLTIIALLGIVLTITAQKIMVYAGRELRDSGVNTFAIFCLNEVMAIVIIPLHLISNWITVVDTREFINCTIILSLMMICLHLVTFFQVMLYLHIYVGVKFPFQYQDSKIKQNLKYIMISIAIFTAVFSIIPFMTNHSDSNNCFYQPMKWWFIVAQIVYGFSPLPLMIIFSIYFVKVAAKHVIKRQQLEKQLAVNSGNITMENSLNNNSNSNTNIDSKICPYCYLMRLKAFQTSFLPIILHFILLEPTYILILVYYFKGKALQEITKVSFDNAVPSIILVILYTSVVLVPLIYFFRKELEVKEVFKIFLTNSKLKIQNLAKPKQDGQCSCKSRKEKRGTRRHIERETSEITTVTTTVSTMSEQSYFGE